MKLKTKLYLGFGVALFIILLLSATTLYTLNQQNKFLQEIVKESHENVKLASSLKSEVNFTAKEIRELLLIEGAPLHIIEEQIQLINKSRENAFVTLELLNQREHEGEVNEKLSSITYLNNNYTTLIEEVIDFVRKGQFEEGKLTLFDDNQIVRRLVLTEIDELTALEETLMNDAITQSEEAVSLANTILTILSVISLVSVIAVSFSVVKSTTKRINEVRAVITAVPNGAKDNLPRINVDIEDEIGEIAHAYNEMADALELYSKQEKKRKEKLEEENWLQTSIAEVATKFQGVQKLQSFADIFITRVAPLVGATYGVLYVMEGNSELKRVSAYAADKQNLGEKTISIGEGLVGQCALDNQMIVVDKLPEDYITTKSGLGNATPTSLIILPIDLDGDVVGVIELAKFHSFSSLEVKLLEEVCTLLGSSINRILDHMKIQKLLTESQTMTEELQSQSEELQQQQEELRMINEQLHEQYKNSAEKTKELEIIKRDLEEKNRSIELTSKYKSEFLANMSHELRTPLNSMLILAQMLSENPEGNLTEKQIEHIVTIHSSGKDLLDLINDILDLSKIESGKIDIYPEEVLIEDVKKFVERQFFPISRQKGITFDITVDTNTPSILYTDDQRLKQILKNLLSNAFKFTDHGSVELQLKPSNKADNCKMAFSVKDTGIGISKEQQNNIFEAFYQGDGTTSRRYGGTGLGLSITKELTQLLGGMVEIESEEGKGSTFTLHLPDYNGPTTIIQDYSLQEIASSVEQEMELEEELVQEEEAHGHENKEKEQETNEVELDNNVQDNDQGKELLENKEILVVDDDMRNVFALTTALETKKMKVHFAENGKEALQILEENPSIDIVLMDIMMPEMDGYEAMKAIRNIDKLKQLPIIALTAKAMKKDKEMCLHAGASDYISKPVNMEQLFSLIKVWLYK